MPALDVVETKVEAVAARANEVDVEETKRGTKLIGVATEVFVLVASESGRQ